MKSELNEFAELFIKHKNNIVDKDQPYYSLLMNTLPSDISRYFPESYYEIKGSVGKGKVANHPWICIFNNTVTTTIQSGIYIALLFRSDLNGFYLCMIQGIEKFVGNSGVEKRANAIKAAQFFSTRFSAPGFTSEPIMLLPKKTGDRGYLYEKSTVISRYFEIDNFSEEDLIDSLEKLKLIYEEVVESLNGRSYADYIQEAILIDVDTPEFYKIDDAEKVVEEAMITLSDLSEGKILTFTQIAIPSEGERKFKNTEKIVPFRKIDYLKQAKSNMELGLSGEELVLKYEKEKLNKAGRPDLADKIKWSSKANDSLGYDILSFEIDENGDSKEIHIEVKTTTGTSKNLFYISTNEIKVFEELKDSYYLYRVCVNKKKSASEFFILNYDDFISKFELTPTAYEVTLKPTTTPQT